MLNSKPFLAAIQVSAITSYSRDFHTHFLNSIRETPTTGLTCRTWLLDALYEMVDWGLLGLHPNRARIDQIEAEVLGRAMNVSGAIERDEEGTVTVSQYFEG
ncbi:hypothetical protein H109_00848 [Trichophyton interdigitale MR816]|uniref:Uncharacterized protein n=1 Tax=Trichophyton interdigitale (strain MR816) TaxID=1215338 RepID=A0A059JI69_TRIIM|nr:hypothetical protein H101_06239 [Trichophyton interdigitale H6]KDB27368.1 hypothetical protein H109_00848 [Trichophyton interdigitale MR816]